MAQQDYSGVITLAVIAGAAWYAYEQGWLSSLFGTAAPATTGTPAAAINCPSPNTLIAGVCTAPVACPAPNTMINGVCTAPAPAAPAGPITFSGSNADPATTAWLNGIAAAAGEGSAPLLNADQWTYYFNQGIAGSVPTTVDLAHPATVDTNVVLSAGNISAANRSTTVMTAGQYLNLVNQAGATGLMGLSSYFGIPAGMIHGGW
jgi:hypothetical protein